MYINKLIIKSAVIHVILFDIMSMFQGAFDSRWTSPMALKKMTLFQSTKLLLQTTLGNASSAVLIVRIV